MSKFLRVHTTKGRVVWIAVDAIELVAEHEGFLMITVARNSVDVAGLTVEEFWTAVQEARIGESRG